MTILRRLVPSTWREVGDRWTHQGPGSCLEFQLFNDKSLVPAVMTRMEDGLSGCGFTDQTFRRQNLTALNEAFVNVIFCGNLDISSELWGIDDGKSFARLFAKRKAELPC